MISVKTSLKTTEKEAYQKEESERSKRKLNCQDLNLSGTTDTTKAFSKSDTSPIGVTRFEQFLKK